jgi:UDP-GlcNAc3NAcA epimerase
MDIWIVVGARPQFIKAAALLRGFLKAGQTTLPSLIHTGQHFDDVMSAIFFAELAIPAPLHHLGVGGGDSTRNTGRMIEALGTLLVEHRPDWVIVVGDTDSTLAGAIAASKAGIPVAHVEAGLRSYRRHMPEESNRVLTDHASDLLFTPNDGATRNLLREGISPQRIVEVGDVMHDALVHYVQAAKGRPTLQEFKLQPRGYVLATVHRAGTVDDPSTLREVIAGLVQSPLPVVWPVHPRTLRRLGEFCIDVPTNIQTVAPQGYLDMLNLQLHAACIATDSGGVQKEACYLGVPCAVLRDETEWVELLASEGCRLAGVSSAGVGAALLAAVNQPQCSRTPADFGDAAASERIAHILTTMTNARAGA